MKKLRLLGVIISIMIIQPAYSIPVSYIIEGDLRNLDDDEYGMDGAHVVFTINTNTDYTPYYLGKYYQYDDAFVQITSRPNNLPNINSNATWDSSFDHVLEVLNYQTLDMFFIATFTIDDINMRTGLFQIWLDQDFYVPGSFALPTTIDNS